MFAALALFVLSALSQEKGSDDLPVLLEEGARLCDGGEYRKAEKFWNELLEESPEHPDYLLGRARVELATGRYEEAGADLAKAALGKPGEDEVLLLWGECLWLQGSYEAAGERWKQMGSERFDLRGKWRRSELAWETGQRGAAKDLWVEIARIASQRIIREPGELLALGRAYERLDKFVAASEVYLEASEKDPDDTDALVALGDLYFRVYGDAESSRASPNLKYRDALKRNPNAVPALLGLYRLYRANFFRSQAETEDFLRRALAVNPRSVPGLLLQAETLTIDRRFSEAAEVVDKALAVQPRHREALSVRAALHFLENQESRFEKIEKDLLLQDPSYGEIYAVLGGFLKDLYRFQDAVSWCRKALERDPELNEARNLLGHALVNAGKEEEGRKELEEAEKRERGFVHPWRQNMLTVLGELRDKYVSVEDSPFVHRLHPDDAEVLRVYLLPWYQEAWRKLSEKYQFTPSDPIYVETFHEAGDFSARTIGFTGFGALGACFGPVVTAVSPTAPQLRRRFHYLETAWHEFAHVITIGLSKSRIPRWLTEGLSTYEEKLRHPSYDRGMDLDLLDAYANDEIYPVRELNAAFRGPRIIFGYYQSGLLCEMLARDFSFARLVRMVKMFGEDRPLATIYEECFGLSPEEIDQRFLEFVREKLRDVRIEPNWGNKKLTEFQTRVAKNPKDVEALRHLAWTALRRSNWIDAESRVRKILEADPEDGEGLLLSGLLSLQRGRKDFARKGLEDGFARGAEEFFARMQYAALLEEEHAYDAAIEQYRLAKRAFPRMRDPRSSPHRALSRLLQGAGKLEEAMRETEEFVALDSSNFDGRLSLAAWYAEKKDFEKAARFFEEANGVDPFHRDLHRRWAECLCELGRFDEAAREWAVARRVRPEMELGAKGPPDPGDERAAIADLWVEEAETWLLAREDSRAKQALREALELLPDHARARELLEGMESAPK